MTRRGIEISTPELQIDMAALSGRDFETSRGSVRVGGQDGSTVDPWDRGIVFVFQSYALWRTKTIFHNVA